jgi:hypothetical protein
MAEVILLVEKLMKQIEEMKEEHLKIHNQIRIAKDISVGTDNVKNLRLICNDLAECVEYIIEKDAVMFNDLNEMLKVLHEVFVSYEITKKDLYN